VVSKQGCSGRHQYQQEAATALPPSAAIIATVRSASVRSRSTTGTWPEGNGPVSAIRPLERTFAPTRLLGIPR
jgi:hypothetical protein